MAAAVSHHFWLTTFLEKTGRPVFLPLIRFDRLNISISSFTEISRLFSSLLASVFHNRTSGFGFGRLVLSCVRFLPVSSGFVYLFCSFLKGFVNVTGLITRLTLINNLLIDVKLYIQGKIIRKLSLNWIKPPCQPTVGPALPSAVGFCPLVACDPRTTTDEKMMKGNKNEVIDSDKADLLHEFTPQKKRGELVPFDLKPEHMMWAAHCALQFEMAGTSAIMPVEEAKEEEEALLFNDPLFVPIRPMAERQEPTIEESKERPSKKQKKIRQIASNLKAVIMKWVLVQKKETKRPIKDLDFYDPGGSWVGFPFFASSSEYYPDLVREFYANMTHKTDKDLQIITSTIKGVRIILHRERLLSILGILGNGNIVIVDSNRKTIDEDPDWNFDAACSRFDTRPQAMDCCRILHGGNFPPFLGPCLFLWTRTCSKRGRT
ncbi:hypothetical protein M9H77_23496 [Catharanthus roseus]|uniref:Uncharacterized protein n=1 Tax=Catharanthus roseus TaxID=4058 RepID=A0ACC0AWC6_CATRO|nr:hypothetical protein M9H77_23496 [Catharanthus roseus]